MNAHQSLLRTAHEAEEKRVQDTEQLKGFKDKIIEGRRVADEADARQGVPGMDVDIPEADAVDELSDEGEQMPTKKVPERKTKKERLKAAKLRAEVCTVAILRYSLLRVDRNGL